MLVFVVAVVAFAVVVVVVVAVAVVVAVVAVVVSVVVLTLTHRYNADRGHRTASSNRVCSTGRHHQGGDAYPVRVWRRKFLAYVSEGHGLLSLMAAREGEGGYIGHTRFEFVNFLRAMSYR